MNGLVGLDQLDTGPTWAWARCARCEWTAGHLETMDEAQAALDKHAASCRGETVSHDFSESSWGWECFVMDVFESGQRLNVGGWGRGVEVGHFLLLPHKNGGATRYCVEEIEYMTDPTDQFFAQVRFSPRPG